MSKNSIDFKQKRKFTKEEVEELSASYRKASSLKLWEERGDWGNGGSDDDKRKDEKIKNFPKFQENLNVPVKLNNKKLNTFDDLFASIDKKLDKIIAILENNKKKK